LSANIPEQISPIKPASAALNFDRAIDEEEFRRKHPVSKRMSHRSLSGQLALFDETQEPQGNADKLVRR
jgi:hypothetical protein